MPTQSATMTPIASAKAALNTAASETQRQLQARAAKGAEELAARKKEEAEANTPENVRARQKAAYERAARDLTEVLKKVAPIFEEKTKKIEQDIQDPARKEIALKNMASLTITYEGEVMKADIRFNDHEDPTNVYYSFNHSEFINRDRQWKESDNWGRKDQDEPDLEDVLANPKAERQTAYLKKFILQCRKHDIGVRVFLLPYIQETVLLPFDDDHGDRGDRHTYRRHAGLFVQIFPMQNFDPKGLPKILRPRPARPKAQSPNPASPAPAV